MKTVISFAAVLRFAALALALAVMWPLAAQATNAKSVADVLQEVKAHAGEANVDAELLDSFTRSNVSWQLHAWCINEIQAHLKDLVEDYNRVQAIKENATPQQRDAINRLQPLLKDMAASLKETMQVLNKHQERVNMPLFRTRIHSDYLKVNKVYSELCKCTAKDSSQNS